MDLLIKYQLTNYVIIVFTINAQLISKLPNQKAISIMCNVYNDTMMKWKINEKWLQKKKKKPITEALLTQQGNLL